MGNDQVAAAVKDVRTELQLLRTRVTEVSGATIKILDCLVNGPDMPEIQPEPVKPVAAQQDFDNKKLVVTLALDANPQTRTIQVVFEGAGPVHSFKQTPAAPPVDPHRA